MKARLALLFMVLTLPLLPDVSDIHVTLHTPTSDAEIDYRVWQPSAHLYMCFERKKSVTNHLRGGVLKSLVSSVLLSGF